MIILIFGGVSSFLIGLLTFIILICFIMYYRVYFRQVARWKKSNVPFLQPTFLIGHKHFASLRKYSICVALDRIYKENQDKDVVAFFMGTIPMTLIKDPKLINQLYAKNSNTMFATGFNTPESEVEAQHMINFTDNKDKWKFARNTMLPTFLPAALAGSRFDKIKKQIDRMWRYAENLEPDGCSIEKITKNFVIDSISLWALGEDSNSYKNKATAFKMFDHFFETSIRRMISIYVMMQFPYFQAINRLKFVSNEICAQMAEFLQQKINHRDLLNTHEDDFIDFLRSLRNNNGPKQESKEGISNPGGITLRQMVGFSLFKLVGGSETVITVSMFALHLLSLYPEHQDTIRREVREVMKKHNVSGFEFRVVQELQFTLQCLYETARLYPAPPALMRHCLQDFQIPGTKYFLRKGDRITMSIYNLHRDPEYFENPDVFDPDRFSPEHRNSISPETFLSFGIGPRKCMGYNQGLLLAVTIVASLLHKYEIKPRSHLKQMDANDFHPRRFINTPAREVIVDIVPLSL